VIENMYLGLIPLLKRAERDSVSLCLTDYIQFSNGNFSETIGTISDN
jgi:hypothetical protein